MKIRLNHRKFEEMHFLGTFSIKKTAIFNNKIKFDVLSLSKPIR